MDEGPLVLYHSKGRSNFQMRSTCYIEDEWWAGLHCCRVGAPHPSVRCVLPGTGAFEGTSFAKELCASGIEVCGWGA